MHFSQQMWGGIVWSEAHLRHAGYFEGSLLVGSSIVEVEYYIYVPCFSAFSFLFCDLSPSSPLFVH